MAPPWGSEVRLNNPPGGLDDPFLGSPGGQTNIFPVTFDQNAPFSLNGPFLSLSNDMASTNVHLWNVTVERQLGPSWVASAGYVGSRTYNIWESSRSTTALFVPVNGAAPSTANLNARRPLFLADPENGTFYGPLDLYVTDGKQRYDGMLLSVRGNGRYGSTIDANYALSNCYGSPEGSGGGTTNVSVGYNMPRDPRFRRRQLRGGPAAQLLGDRRDPIATIRERRAGAPLRPAGGWRELQGAHRPLAQHHHRPDIALNGQPGTQRVNQVLDDPYGDQSTNPQNGGIGFPEPAAFVQPASARLERWRATASAGQAARTSTWRCARLFRLTDTAEHRGSSRDVQRLQLVPMGTTEHGSAVPRPSGRSPNTALGAEGAPRIIQFGCEVRRSSVERFSQIDFAAAVYCGHSGRGRSEDRPLFIRRR